VSCTFRCALIFVDTYAHTLFLEVNSIFQLISFCCYLLVVLDRSATRDLVLFV
jgi:hypothetical protein